MHFEGVQLNTVQRLNEENMFCEIFFKMCNLCQAGTTTVLVEYKTLKQTSRFHFSQKTRAQIFEDTWSFVCWQQSCCNAKIRVIF